MLANPLQHAQKEQGEGLYCSRSAICLRRLQTQTLVSKGLLSHIIAIIGFAGLNSISKGCVLAGAKLVAEVFISSTFIWLDCFIRRAFRSIILRLCKETVKSKISALCMGRALSWLRAALFSKWEHAAVRQTSFWTGCEAIKYILYNQTHSFWLL